MRNGKSSNEIKRQNDLPRIASLIDGEIPTQDWSPFEVDQEEDAGIDLNFMDKYIEKFNESISLPNGTYTMIVDDIFLKQSEHGIHQFHWILHVVNNEKFEDVSIERINTLTDNEKPVNLFLQDLRICRVNIHHFSEINDNHLRSQIVGAELCVQVARKDGKVQYYLQRRIK